ncbi:hypothetical protein [Tangfeifania diversioriginum]|uniref:hypothetical protein n=1 Tax=Tangfeifania diversioriginum TaxID=1168035 RepID=UPI001C317CAD|nr:hypothetical protein [Tangfeifania diversioriginum]
MFQPKGIIPISEILLIYDTQKAIQTVFDIRNATPRGLKGDFHPLAKLPLTKHPFEANK